MQNKAVFLDRDGVINVDRGYVYKIEDLEFIPESVDALKRLQDSGYMLIIITNQSGIGRGYYTEQDYFKFRKEMARQLKEKGVIIAAEYYCPHSPEEKCRCRKPHAFLIEKAAEEHDIDLKKSFFIGDKTSDILAGKNAGLKTILVLTGKGGKDKRYLVSEDFSFSNLFEASKFIKDI